MTTDSGSPLLTPDEERLLRHEELVARVLALRSRPEPGASPKPWWQRLLESTGGTALVTVLVGGIAGSVITGVIQTGQKDRDFQQEWLKARGEQARLAYKEYAEGELKTVQAAYEQVGAMLASAQDLIVLTESRFDPARYEGAERDKVLEQRRQLREAFNTADAAWRRRRETQGLMMSYYHRGSPAIQERWRAVEVAVDAFVDCARTWHGASSSGDDTARACAAERAEGSAALDRLNEALGAERRYLWAGWESPGELKEQLAGRAREAGAAAGGRPDLVQVVRTSGPGAGPNP